MVSLTILDWWCFGLRLDPRPQSGSQVPVPDPTPAPTPASGELGKPSGSSPASKLPIGPRAWAAQLGEAQLRLLNACSAG